MRKIFDKEIFIRLEDDFSSFVSTVTYAKVFSRTKEYSLDTPAPEYTTEGSLTLKRSRERAGDEEL